MFVFLHGAGAGPWVWERVIQHVGRSGLALDYPGRVQGATPDRCAEAIVTELDRRRIGDVVLVLHSLAGVLTRDLAARLGHRLRGCVFLSAVVPPPGGSFVDSVGFVNGAILRILFRMKPHGLRPSPKMIERELCNDLDSADAEEVVARYAAEMPGLYLTPSGTHPIESPTTYIKLLHDRSVTPGQQQAMIARLERARVRELPAGHLAMLSMPRALGKVIGKESWDLPAET